MTAIAARTLAAAADSMSVVQLSTRKFPFGSPSAGSRIGSMMREVADANGVTSAITTAPGESRLLREQVLTAKFTGGFDALRATTSEIHDRLYSFSGWSGWGDMSITSGLRP